MSRFGDPAIKLFGKTISLPIKDKISITYASVACKDDSISVVSLHSHRICSGKDTTALNQVLDEEDVKKSSGLEVMNHETDTSTSPKTPCVDKETSSRGTERTEEESNETSNSDEKMLKKPDKIIPCPRCNSMDTKFCYYNNYNVNQPRHFCKNCQRYWTAGGTMRNVPVGAGRRKHKQAYRHIFHNPILVNDNGSLLNFGPDAPTCESKKTGVDLSSNNYNSTESGLPSNPSSSSQEHVVMNLQGIPLPVPYFPGPTWTPSLGPSGFPVSFCPTPSYWGYTVTGSWPVPYIPTPPPNSINNIILTSSPNLLGKHSRDAKDNLMQENNMGSGVWMPKTLRIDDPSVAAKSSIWETLGIKNDKTSSMNERGMFKTIKSKGDKGEGHNGESLSSLMHANPAAMSRSQNFHETT